MPAARAETDVPRLYLDTRHKHADHREGPLSVTCTPLLPHPIEPHPAMDFVGSGSDSSNPPTSAPVRSKRPVVLRRCLCSFLASVPSHVNIRLG